ncbi:hypothetical protein ACETU7_05220 [Rhodococcus sp. 3Y1]
MPSLLSMVGSLPAAVLALVLAAVHQGIALRNKGAIARARSGFAIHSRVSDQSGLKNSSIEIQNHATIAATERNASTNGNANACRCGWE